MKELLAVVWPSGRSPQSSQPLAPRLDSLLGKTICGLYNGAYYFDQTWPWLKEMLSKRFPGVKFVGVEEFGRFFSKDEAALHKALPDKLKEYGCDAVISGRGC